MLLSKRDPGEVGDFGGFSARDVYDLELCGAVTQKFVI